MPVISRFLGRGVARYWADHAPLGFYDLHVKYAECETRVNVLAGTVEGEVSNQYRLLALFDVAVRLDEYPPILAILEFGERHVPADL